MHTAYDSLTENVTCHSCTNLSDDGLTESQGQTVQLSADPPLSGSDASCQCSSSRFHWRRCRSRQAGLDLGREQGRASTTHQGLWGVGGSQWGTWLCLLQRRQHSELAPVEWNCQLKHIQTCNDSKSFQVEIFWHDFISTDFFHWLDS